MARQVLGRAPIERHFPWRELREVSRRQGTRKPPIYSVHRWWARRPPELYRAILRHLAANGSDDARPLAGQVILDPFMGGGTTLVEAQRLGADVIGFDTEDLACRVTALELGRAPDPGVWEEIEKVFGTVEAKLRPCYGRAGAWEVLHYFWVDRVQCGRCDRSFDAHPEALLARDPRPGRTVGFCLYCSRLHLLDGRHTCIECSCGQRTRLSDSNARGGKYYCPWCGHEESIRRYVARMAGTPPTRRLVAKEEVHHRTQERRYRLATWRDRALFHRAARRLRRVEGSLPIPQAPVWVIPGDSRPRSYGYRRYREMFNARQLLHHGSVLKAVLTLREPARSIAVLAFSQSLETNCMFCPYASAWGRLAGLFSIHGYMYVTRPVELNPWWLGVGRGTLRNCLARIRRGLESKGDVPEGTRAAVFIGSLERTNGLDRCGVDYIVTDPPYFDNLDYAYLARFHSVWLRGVPLGCRGVRRLGGVPIRGSGGDSKEFRRRIAVILTRCRKLLKRRGLLVFTFAHRSPQAWQALRSAIRRAGFRVTAVYGVETEGQNGFHNSAGNLRWNALFVCRRRGSEARMLSAELRRAMRARGVSRWDRANLRLALKTAKACR